MFECSSVPLSQCSSLPVNQCSSVQALPKGGSHSFAFQKARPRPAISTAQPSLAFPSLSGGKRRDTRPLQELQHKLGLHHCLLGLLQNPYGSPAIMHQGRVGIKPRRVTAPGGTGGLFSCFPVTTQAGLHHVVVTPFPMNHLRRQAVDICS